MTIQRFRDVADMPPPPRTDPAASSTFARIKELWAATDHLPPLFPPGVTRFRSVEELDRAREEALIARMRAVRAARARR